MTQDALDRLFSLAGKVALVTGGTRGIGRALAIGLARAGADVAVSSQSGRDREVRSAIEAAGRRYRYFRCDLSRREERATLVPAVAAELGRLDILVNNAGVTHRAPCEQYPLEQWDRVISVMLTAVFELSQAAARVMIPQGGGRIINVASLLSFQGGLHVPAYAAAKSGVAGLTRSLANEWAAKGINVNAIAPGYIATDLTEPLVTDPVRGPQILQRIPAGRWGEPEDLVGAAIFLASDASRYVHGHLLVVDGGWLGR